MSGERRHQQGKFENYYPGRNELRDDILNREGVDQDFEIERDDLRNRPSGDGRSGPSAQNHKGKGPRDYKRRDERILEDINDRLCDNPYLDASEIEVRVSEGNVVLSGSVENRESKRLAEDIAESVSGVENVENGLRVHMRGI
jgi:hypothetical protein